MVKITETEQEQIFAFTLPGHDKNRCFKPKKKDAQNGHASNCNGNADRRNY
jgi:hypothetical protein